MGIGRPTGATQTASLRQGSQAWLPVAALLVGGLAISGQSFWIDEANSAEKAVADTWAGFVELLVDREGSDLQMPGYMAGLWAWEKMVGSSERALRGFNLPWLLLGVTAVAAYWRVAPALRLAVGVCLLLSPFTWYYLDEARPYALQIGAGTLAVCALHHLLLLREPARRTADLAVFLTGTLLLSVSSLFAMVLAALFFAALGLGLACDRQEALEWLRSRSTWLVLAGFAVPFLALAGYYVWTLTLGVKASTVGSTGPLNLAFAFYELAGFNGLGPDRNTIRENLAGAFYPHLATLGLGLLAYLALGGAALVRMRTMHGGWRAPLLVAAGLIVAAVAVAYGVGWMGNFRLLGRHLTPIFPLIIMASGAALLAAWQSRVGRVAGVGFLAVMLVSSLTQRLHPRFAKDDYRAAARMALEEVARGGVVWWAADSAAAAYYGVQAGHAGDEAAVFYANNRKPDYVAALPRPTLVILSKVDVYDHYGTLRQWMAAHDFGLQPKNAAGFTFWRGP